MNVTEAIQQLQNEAAIHRALHVYYGDDPQCLHAQAQRYRAALKTYRTCYGEQNIIIVRAPGRVDLLGSHTDYHQGCVLTMALDRDTVLVAGRRDDRTIRVASTDPAFQPQTFGLRPEIPRSPAGNWENYVKAAAQAFVRQYGLERLRGLNAVICGASDYSVPIAAGLSSSSALLVAAALALARLNAIAVEPKRFARFCGQAEWYVGTRGGFMDHLTSLLNRRGHALFLDCRPVVINGEETLYTDDIPLPPDYVVAIGNTNVKKEKSASAEYNTRVLETKVGVELLKPHFPDAQFLRDIPADAPLHTLLPPTFRLSDLPDPAQAARVAALFADHQVSPDTTLHILPRCRHIISENTRVLQASACLQAGDLDGFGQQMRGSYLSMRDDFAGTCAELETMVEAALHFPGTLGARVAGAGWGGCAVALVRAAEATAFRRQIARVYSEATGIRPDIFICQPSQGADCLQLDSRTLSAATTTRSIVWLVQQSLIMKVK
jgi:galactokinase